MARVLVIELPDDAQAGDNRLGLAEAIRAIREAGALPDGARVHAAIREDADRVLAVFQTGGS